MISTFDLLKCCFCCESLRCISSLPPPQYLVFLRLKTCHCLTMLNLCWEQSLFYIKTIVKINQQFLQLKNTMYSYQSQNNFNGAVAILYVNYNMKCHVLKRYSLRPSHTVGITGTNEKGVWHT